MSQNQDTSRASFNIFLPSSADFKAFIPKDIQKTIFENVTIFFWKQPILGLLYLKICRFCLFCREHILHA